MFYREADYDLPDVQPGGQHIARKADITLQTADDYQFAFDNEFETLGPSDGIGSQDFELDLGIDFGDGPALPSEPAQEEDESMEVEFGRDAAPPRLPRESLASQYMGGRGEEMDIDIFSQRSRGPSEHPFDADMNLDFRPDDDLGLSFDDKPLSEHEPTPRLTPSRACKWSHL